MPTVIDSLILKLGFDTAGISQGRAQTQKELQSVREEATRTGKSMEEDGKRAAEFFAQVKNEAIALMGVLVGGAGLESFVRDATTSLAALGREAHNIGMAAPDLAAFRNMIERNGGSADAATQSFRSLTDEMEKFKIFGQSSIIQFLNPIGAQRGDTAMEVYMKFVKFAQDHANDAPLINLIGHGLGLDQGSINEAMKGLNQVTSDLRRSYQLGVPTQDMIDRVTKLQESFIALQQAAIYLGDTMLANNAGWMTTFNEWLTFEITNNPKVVEGITAVVGALGLLTAVRLSAKTMGLVDVVYYLDWMLALVGKISAGLAALALTGPAGGQSPESETEKTTKSLEQQGALSPDTGVSGWIRGKLRSMGLGWLAGQGATPADEASVSRSLGELPPSLGGTGGVGTGGRGIGGALPPDIEAEVRRQAGLRGLDPDHMVRLFRKEHGGYNAVSPAGAFGPAQLMPGTAARFGVSQSDPWQKNVQGGLDYYKWLLQRFNGNVVAADAAYNAGENNAGVMHYFLTGDPSRLPAETRDYINSIDAAPGPRAPITPDPSLNLSPATRTSAQSSLLGGDQDNSTTVQIANLNVHSAAKDASGIASDLHSAIADETILQANRGLV